MCKNYEIAWGTVKYAFIYMASGILGNLTSALLMPYTLGVGASGAIMGVLGARVGEGLVRYYDEAGGIVDLSEVICAITMVLLLSFMPFVDWPAHLGGALAGLGIGTCIFAFSSGSWRSRPKFRVASIVILVALVLAINTMLAMVIVLDFSGYGDLADVCEHYTRYFEQYGIAFECECNINRLSWITGSDN